MNQFLERLESARSAAGISKYELAKRLGVRPSNVGGWFSGEYRPGWDQFPILASHLGVKMSWLLGEDDASPTPIAPDRALDILREAISQRPSAEPGAEKVSSQLEDLQAENAALREQLAAAGLSAPPRRQIGQPKDRVPPRKRDRGGAQKKVDFG